MRLLLVDDDPRARRALSSVLEGLGHTLVTTTTQIEALRRLEAERFDAVFTELATPRIDGMELLRTVRRRWPETRGVVLTGAADVDSAVEAMRAGAIDYVRKPVDEERVHSVLEHLDREPARPVPGRELAALARSELLPRVRPPVLTDHDLGSGRLERGVSDGRLQKVLRIDATGAPPNLLARLLVGSYITGQDQILITARDGLSTVQRKEIHRMVDRILGMSVVGDSPAVVEVQNFVDPGKYELPRLLHRVVRMLRSELEACRAALSGQGSAPLQQIASTEEEIDRFYLLMVRQLLLSSDSPQIARSIDVESHHYQIGYRLVAKVLEVLGDLIHGIGIDLDANLAGLRRMPSPLLRQLIGRVERLEQFVSRTMDAFARLSVVDANATLNEIGEALPKDTSLGQLIARRVSDRRIASAAQRVVCNLIMSLEMLIIVNEVTINRSVEPETVARTGTSVRILEASRARPHAARARRH